MCLLASKERLYNSEKGTMMSGDGENRSSPLIKNSRWLREEGHLQQPRPAEDIAAFSTEGFGGLEVGVQGNAMIMGKMCTKHSRIYKFYLATVITYMNMTFHAAPLVGRRR